MTRRPGGSEGPEDVDAAFAEIVAGLEREGLGASLLDVPADPPVEAPVAEPDTSEGPPAVWRASAADWDPDAIEADEHFVPPEPPPLPRLRPGTLLGILLLAVGIMLLAAPTVVGLAPRIGTPLALICLATGIGWLVLRMRQGPPPDSGWDDGAQV